MVLKNKYIVRAADRDDPAFSGDRSADDAQLHWQCVAICLDHRRYGLTTIERHRLNQFIALYRAASQIRKSQRYAVMQVIAVYQARRKYATASGGVSTPVRRGRKRRAASKRRP